MKTFFKFLGILLLILVVFGTVFYLVNNEEIPVGKKVPEADELAEKMLQALEYDAFKNTEIITWSFSNHNYTWNKQEGFVHVSWNDNKVILNTKNPNASEAFVDNVKVESPKLIQTATNYFNNDSFWVVAPYKVMDSGTERRLVDYNDKDALLITYTSGGSTPGDSYLWILDENYLPVSFKMWTKIIPIGGISATWHNLKTTSAGIKLPTTHTLSLFGFEIPIKNVKAYNPKADALANKVLTTIKHEAYKKTQFLEWSFAGKRSYKWDKKNNIAEVSWDSIRVKFHTKDKGLSKVYVNNKLQHTTDLKFVNKAERFFNNDSFWLVAPHKLFDYDTYRYITKVENEEALLVKYTKGGSTPGDSYVWILDTNFIPKSYKMYIPSMKMDGISATWQDWKTTESGTLLPTNHSFANGRILSMGEVKGYN